LIVSLHYNINREIPEEKFQTYSVINTEKGVFKINHETGQTSIFLNSLFIELRDVSRDEVNNMSNSSPNQLLFQVR
jgi:hypothetical protein